MRLRTAPLVLVTLAASGAVADEPGMGFEGFVGASFTNGAHAVAGDRQDPSGGITAGFALVLHDRWLRAGATLDGTSVVFGPNLVHAGALAGAAWDLLPSLQLELLGEAGWSHWSQVGADLFTTASGDDSASFAYLGARASLAWRFGAEHHGILGAWVALREDLGRRTLFPTTMDCFFGCSTQQEQWTVGGETVSFGIRIGFEG